MKKTLLEGGVWVAAGLVWWLAPSPWKNLAYVLIGVAVIVAVSSYLDSRRRLQEAKTAADAAKRDLDELRKKSD